MFGISLAPFTIEKQTETINKIWTKKTITGVQVETIPKYFTTPLIGNQYLKEKITLTNKNISKSLRYDN